ncbi:MAG TPA: hypothetical protein VLU54_14725 [Casimicrobiaceae bacterium]|nr:hypothetical protein [Casimicrobiaceae bacterium]
MDMQLLDELQRRLEGEPSLFRAQLLREDIARLTRLSELARSTDEYGAFTKAAMRLGWTQGDARTQELAGPLGALLEAVYAYCRESVGGTAAGGSGGTRDAAQEARIAAAWSELHRVRMERLVGCLSNPVPRPTD